MGLFKSTEAKILAEEAAASQGQTEEEIVLPPPGDRVAWGNIELFASNGNEKAKRMLAQRDAQKTPAPVPKPVSLQPNINLDFSSTVQADANSMELRRRRPPIKSSTG